MRKIISLIKVPIRPLYVIVLKWLHNLKLRNNIKQLSHLDKDVAVRIFYLGTTTHNNLGDNAQFYCIREWIRRNFHEYPVYEFIAPAIVHPKLHFITKFKKELRQNDIIVFQSGYTTQDLGGQHEEMHRLIIDNCPSANILMMPQTIFFTHKENEQRCSDSYNKAEHMLFLARDIISYNKSKVMFPHITTMVFPDIVTTLIGQYYFDNKRDGVLLCRRNDGEKYYSEAELVLLANKIEQNLSLSVEISDTSINMGTNKLHQNLKAVLECEFEKYSRYKLIITDRYHGTIFSLIAGTPVIVIKTNDHKVITGIDWFKGIYDDYVYYADTLDDAYCIAKNILTKDFSHKLEPYFVSNYYDKLIEYFNRVI